LLFSHDGKPSGDSSFEVNRNYQCSLMAALTARPGAT
jgi:hypothetical protein